VGSGRGSAIAAGVVVALLAGCGHGSAVMPARSVVLPHPTDTPLGVPVDLQLVALYDAISGTARQRSAGEYVSNRRFEDPLVACMAAAGLPYSPGPFIDHWANYTSDGAADDTNWLAPLHNPVLTREAQVPAGERKAEDRAESKRPAPTSVAARDPQRYSGVLNGCQSQEGTGYEAAGQPRDYYALLRAFHTMLDQIDGSLRRYAGPYRQCMSARGFPVRSYQGLFASIRARIPRQSWDIPAPGQAGGPQWRHVVAYESRALDADASCRADAYRAGLARLGPAIVTFEQTHAAEIRATEAAWKAIVATANRYPGSPGFS
jgi:hypothetical protein